MALALLAGALVGIAAALSGSLDVMRASRGQLTAHRAAEATAESLRSVPYSFVYKKFWSDPGLSVATLGAPARPFVSGGDVDGHLAAVQDEILAPACSDGAMAWPLSGPALAIRFLGEDESETLWGSQLDLDLSGTVGDSIPPPATGSADPGYTSYPLLVHVRWHDDNGPQSFTLATVLAHEAPLDPQRQ